LRKLCFSAQDNNWSRRLSREAGALCAPAVAGA